MFVALSHTSRPARTRPSRHCRRRRGAVLVLTALLMIVMMALLAFSLDVGYMMTMKTELQRSVDSAALAGAGALVDGDEAATSRVVEYMVRNPVGSGIVLENEDELETKIAAFLDAHEEDLDVKLGHWDPDTKTFQESSFLPSTISVTMTQPNMPLFFARVLGQDTFQISASSVAMYQPRDIVLVLDLSGSMNDDSEFGAINALGQASVEDNLEMCYEDLGSPTYGDMTLEPQYITVVGQPPNHPATPQVSVEYRYKSVYVTSSKDLSNVVLEYHDGTHQKFEGLSGHSQVFQGTGSNSGKAIYKVWVKSGNNASGEGPGYGEPFAFYPNSVNQTIRTALGLDGVPYPYESGSWNSYFNYVKSYNTTNRKAGYRWKFGYLNLMNYWLEKKPASYQTSDLWKVSAQPITAVKDAVDVFMDYIQEVDTNDRVGVVVYNAYDGEGKLETPLTDNFQLVKDTVRQRQAAHYHNYTNIGAGMQWAREHLNAEGRLGAFKMIVLMTDGKANWVNGGYNTSAAKQYVLDEAELSAQKRYPVVTISLGAGADTSLMQQVADGAYKGHHFNVPGGQSVEDYSEDLKEVFRDIAKDRPLKIVK